MGDFESNMKEQFGRNLLGEKYIDIVHIKHDAYM